jgi:hypothetical protein
LTRSPTAGSKSEETTATIDRYPVISEDGQTLFDDQSQGKITVRDAAGAIVQEIATAGEPPLTGIRMGVGRPASPRAHLRRLPQRRKHAAQSIATKGRGMSPALRTAWTTRCE